MPSQAENDMYLLNKFSSSLLGFQEVFFYTRLNWNNYQNTCLHLIVCGDA